MRKALGLVLAVLAAAIGSPSAYADAYVYTYTVNLDPSVYGATITTKPMQAVTTANVILTPVDLRSYSLTGSFYLADLNEFILNYGGGGDQAIETSNGLGTASATYSGDDQFPLSDYSTPGTYSTYSNGVLIDTLTVSRVPEPDTLGLMLTGVGLLGLMMVMGKRLRIPQGS
ncbi:MAG TPA: PEP-CTERM sorting domain-containing protein [Candidatus Sulfotelmatobacter sp.]|nr:PEP-CTERM sorting domain-containing protein [Candidatus Sulfotelmatobacter sp.]